MKHRHGVARQDRHPGRRGAVEGGERGGYVADACASAAAQRCRSPSGSLAIVANEARPLPPVPFSYDSTGYPPLTGVLSGDLGVTTRAWGCRRDTAVPVSSWTLHLGPPYWASWCSGVRTHVGTRTTTMVPHLPPRWARAPSPSLPLIPAPAGSSGGRFLRRRVDNRMGAGHLDPGCLPFALLFGVATVSSPWPTGDAVAMRPWLSGSRISSPARAGPPAATSWRNQATATGWTRARSSRAHPSRSPSRGSRSHTGTQRDVVVTVARQAPDRMAIGPARTITTVGMPRRPPDWRLASGRVRQPIRVPRCPGA